MKLGKWSDINWKRVWLIVLIAYLALLFIMPIWGWYLESWLIK